MMSDEELDRLAKCGPRIAALVDEVRELRAELKNVHGEVDDLRRQSRDDDDKKSKMVDEVIDVIARYGYAPLKA